MDKWLRNNNVVKVIALMIGVLLWVVVHMNVQSGGGVSTTDVRTDTFNSMMVTPVNMDANTYTVEMIEPSEVTLILKGKTSTLRKLNPKCEVDLSKYDAGTHNVPVRISNVPSSVTVEVIPQTVKVTIEEKQKKEVPVVITVSGTPEPGFKAGQPIVKPGRVIVTVPKSLLDSVEVARGEVNIDKASSAVSKQVKLSVFDKNGKEIAGGINPQIVDVEVPITSPFKTMPLQVKVVGQPAKGYAVASMIQKTDQVTVYGPQDVLDKLDFYTGNGLQVDISGLNADKTFVLDVPLLDRVTLVDPAKVELAFTIVPSVTKTFDQIPISIVGQNGRSVAKVVSPDSGMLSLTLEGASPLLDKLKPQDIQAIVDVSNLPTGTHDLNVTVNLPAYINRVSAAPLQTTVEISSKEAPSPSPSPTPSPSSLPSPSPTPSPIASPSAEAATGTTTSPSP